MDTLKEVRKQIGITQVDAAKLCGVSRRTYQTYEERGNISDAYDEILSKLKELGITEKGPSLLNIRLIKEKTKTVFAKYEEVRCAFLFGSYARNEATVKSDVDILIVSSTMGLKLYRLADELEEALGKKVDLSTHRQITDNESFLARLLTEGIKIYG